MNNLEDEHEARRRRRARFGLIESRSKSDVSEWLEDRGSIAAFLALATIAIFAIIAFVINLTG